MTAFVQKLCSCINDQIYANILWPWHTLCLSGSQLSCRASKPGWACPSSIGLAAVKSSYTCTHGLLLYLSTWAVGSDQPFLFHTHKFNPGQLSALLITSVSRLAKLPSSAHVCVRLRVENSCFSSSLVYTWILTGQVLLCTSNTAQKASHKWSPVPRISSLYSLLGQLAFQKGEKTTC